MLGWSIPSAVFIDYENVAHRVLPETIANWVAWLERGEFDAKRNRRKFLLKRIYWNSSLDHLREKFEHHDFEPIVCEKFTGLKNGADIKMAIDVIEATLDDSRIREFILVTRDSDFVPVLQKLREKKKRTAILVDPTNAMRARRYRTHADIVISMDKFLNATTYRTPGRREELGLLITTLRARMGEVPSRIVARLAARRAAAEAATQQEELIDLAVRYCIRTTSLKPNVATASRAIEAELARIPGFSKSGSTSYLGKGGYRALMFEIAQRTDRIKVTENGPGISVTYVPRDDEARQQLWIKHRKLRRRGWPPR